MRTRWLLRILLAGAIGWTLPASAPAQDSPPVPLPPPVASAAAANPAVVIHTNVPEPPASLNLSPPTLGIGPTAPPGPGAMPEFVPEAPRASGRFHILPQSFRERIARRFGRGVSEAPVQPADFPASASTMIQVNPAIVPATATGEPTPTVQQEGFTMPAEFVPDAPAPSGRFHILPQSWRDAMSRRVGWDGAVPQEQSTEMPAPGTTVEPPIGQGATPPSAGAVVTASARPQTVPLGPPETLAPPAVANPPVDGFGLLPFRAPETWASPAEPPITSQPPLPLREPWMGWSKQPISQPLPLPPPPAPPYPARFHILPEGVRKTLGHCLNGCGMGCYADRDTPGCGSLRQEFLFVFGSCRYFFSEGCFPDYLERPESHDVNRANH